MSVCLQVTPGGKADRAGLKAGDVILAINNNETAKLSHLDAQSQVKSSTSMLLLKIERFVGVIMTINHFLWPHCCCRDD